jgi:hypothetical protein
VGRQGHGHGQGEEGNADEPAGEYHDVMSGMSRMSRMSGKKP